MSYIPPITMDIFYENTADKIVKEQINRQDHFIYEQVMAVSNIKIDEEEFKRALNYDRGQYNCGYRDGYYARDNEIIRCKDCKYLKEIDDTSNLYVCDRIDIGMDGEPSFLSPENDFCSRWERKETE